MGAFLAVLLPLMLAPPVAAAELTAPCTLHAESFAADGAPIDTADAPGPNGSQANPFKMTWHGRVDFRFDTGVLFSNNHWNVRLEGLPVLSGKDDNPSDLDEVGNVKISSSFPYRLVGLFNVSGDLFGNGDTTHCAGDGWIYLLGDPIGTIPWLLAVALILLGLLGLIATPYVPWEQTGHDELPP